MAAKITCTRCKKQVEPLLMTNGVCLDCMQLLMKEKSKIQEELKTGVDSSLINELTSDVEFDDNAFNHWLTFGQGNYSSPELNNNKELKRIWVMVKLNAAGITEQKYIRKLEKLFDKNFEMLKNVPCRIIVANNESEVDLSKVIDRDENLYIVRA